MRDTADAAAFTATVESPKAFVGFRIIEVPIAVVREMVTNGQGGPGAQRLCDEHPFAPDLSAVSVNEFDFSLTVVKDADGRYKQLEKAKPAVEETPHPEFGGGN